MNTFEKIEELLELQSDNEYLVAKKRFEDKSLSEAEHSSARLNLINIIASKFSNNNRIKGNLDISTMFILGTYNVDLKKEADNISFKVNSLDSDTQMYTLLSILNNMGIEAKQSFYLDLFAKGLIQAGNVVSSTTAVMTAQQITPLMSLEEKKSKVLTALAEIKETVKNKLYRDHKNEKDIVKENLHMFDEAYAEIKKSLESKDTIDYRPVYEEFLKTINLELKAYKTGPVKENSTGAKPNNNPGTSLQKRPTSGIMNKTFQPPQKGKKKWLKYVAGGLVVVCLASGIYFIVRHSNKNAIPVEEPSISDNVDLPDPTADIELTIPQPIESATPTETPSSTNTPNITVTETPTTTPTTPTTTPTENQAGTPSVNNEIQAKIDTAADTIYSNWSKFSSQNNEAPYDKDEIKELIKCLNGMESKITQAQADEMILDMLNRAFIPAVNNALVGQQHYQTHSLDLVSLLINNQDGKDAAKSMQLYLNGCLTDANNTRIYGERAFTDEALLLSLGQTVDGFNLSSGDPAVKLLWSRLAIGVNGIVGTACPDLSVIVGNMAYGSKDIDSSVLENIASQAKQEMGQTEYKISF